MNLAYLLLSRTNDAVTLDDVSGMIRFDLYNLDVWEKSYGISCLIGKSRRKMADFTICFRIKK